MAVQCSKKYSWFSVLDYTWFQVVPGSTECSSLGSYALFSVLASLFIQIRFQIPRGNFSPPALRSFRCSCKGGAKCCCRKSRLRQDVRTLFSAASSLPHKPSFALVSSLLVSTVSSDTPRLTFPHGFAHNPSAGALDFHGTEK